MRMLMITIRVQTAKDRYLNIIPKEKIRTALWETLEYTNAKIVVIAHTAVSVAKPKKAITGK